MSGDYSGICNRFLWDSWYIKKQFDKLKLTVKNIRWVTLHDFIKTFPWCQLHFRFSIVFLAHLTKIEIVIFVVIVVVSVICWLIS